MQLKLTLITANPLDVWTLLSFNHGYKSSCQACQCGRCLTLNFWLMTRIKANVPEGVCAQSLSWVQLFMTPWTVAYQAPLSVEFSRQGYWRGLPFPIPRLKALLIHLYVSSFWHTESYTCLMQTVLWVWRYCRHRKTITIICITSISITSKVFCCSLWLLFVGPKLHGMRDLSSPTRDWTCTPCIGSMETSPLDHHGNPFILCDNVNKQDLGSLSWGGSPSLAPSIRCIFSEFFRC